MFVSFSQLFRFLQLKIEIIGLRDIRAEPME